MKLYSIFKQYLLVFTSQTWTSPQVNKPSSLESQTTKAFALTEAPSASDPKINYNKSKLIGIIEYLLPVQFPTKRQPDTKVFEFIK